MENMELNLNEMEIVNGGNLFSDILFIALTGPVGEALVATKHILEATK